MTPLAQKLPKSREGQSDRTYNTVLILSVLLPFAFLPLLNLALSTIGEEKRTKLLTPLRRMGLNEGAYFLSAYVSMIFMSGLSAGFLTIGSELAGSFLDSIFFSSVDKSLLFLVSFVYALGLSAFGLLIVAVFSKELYLSLSQGIFLLDLIPRFRVRLYLLWKPNCLLGNDRRPPSLHHARFFTAFVYFMGKFLTHRRTMAEFFCATSEDGIYCHKWANEQ